MYGGTVGHPIIKNKLFNFVAYEGWKKTDPQTLTQTLPTDLERTGDFSQSLNGSGGLRTIYDPWTTLTSPDGATVTRTPYPGNKIPGSVQDPVALHYMGQLWKPNRPGTGNYHLNNYVMPLPISFPYKNFSDRADYQMTDNLRVSGRYSFYKTPVTPTNPTGSDYFQSDRGASRDASSYTGDVTWTASANTVLNFRGEYHNFVDASKYANDFSGHEQMGGDLAEFEFLQADVRVGRRTDPVAAHVDQRDGQRPTGQHRAGRRLLGPAPERRPVQLQDVAAAGLALPEGGRRHARQPGEELPLSGESGLRV